MYTVITHSTDATKAVAQLVGLVLRGGEVFELISDVGGGKTTFTKGLAHGLGINEVVQSPTFTISRIYKARESLELHHFDFYRLNQAGVVAAELAESLAQPNAIVVIEWGDIVHDVLPAQHIKLHISSLDDNSRKLIWSIPPANAYISDVLAAYQDTKDIA